MKKYFSESYNHALAGLEKEKLESRFAVVNAYCKRKNFNVYELVKMYFVLQGSSEFLEEFASLFREKDVSFDGNNTRELSILAGIILYYLMQSTGYNYFVAFSLLALSPYDIDVPYPRLIEIAYETLERLSKETREVTQEYKNNNLRVILNHVTSLKDSQSLDVTGITSIYKAFGSVVESLKVIINNQELMENALEVYKEESDILAWLFGSWSNDLSVKLHHEVSQKQIVLVIAKELTDLVRVMPGPYSFRAFLDKMLSYCKLETDEFSMVEIVDAAPIDLQKAMVQFYSPESSALEATPILFAIQSALGCEKTDVWKHTVNSKFKFEICNLKKTVLEWSVQMYYECMLIKSSEEWRQNGR